MPVPIQIFGRAALATGRYIAAVTALETPPDGARDPKVEWKTSAELARYAVPELVSEAKTDQGAVVDTVTGATFTSRAFAASLQGAIAKVASTEDRTDVVVGPTEAARGCLPTGPRGGCTELDYGNVKLQVTEATAVTAAAANGHGGYWLVNALGEVSGHMGAAPLGQPRGIRFRDPVVAMAATPDGRGYLLIDRSGQIYAYGDAPHLANAPGGDIVGIAMAPGGHGYWTVTSSGSVHAFGTADRLGSLTGAAAAGSGVVGMAPTADGRGYWLATSQGHVYAFGDAVVRGPAPDLAPKAGFGMSLSPGLVTGIESSPQDGYILFTSAGFIYRFGAGFGFYQPQMSNYGVGGQYRLGYSAAATWSGASQGVLVDVAGHAAPLVGMPFQPSSG
jgi:hypothetical protein